MSIRIRVRATLGIAAMLLMAAGVTPAIAQEAHAAEGLAAEIGATVRDVVRHVTSLHDSAFVEQDRSRNFKAEQTKRETKSLTLGPNGTLDLKNVSGDVNVTTGGGRDGSIELIYRSRGRTDADAKTGLEKVSVTVQQRGDRTTVESIYPHEREAPYSVDVTYNVVVPPGTAVTAGTTGGNVMVKGVKGDVTASSIGGNVTVSESPRVTSASTVGGNVNVTGVNSDFSFRAETMGGNIRLQQVKARRVTASTVGGDVTAHNITCDNAELGTIGGSVEYSGALARNGRYQLHAQSGTVTLVPEGNNGFELEASTFSGEVRSDFPLQMQATTQGRGPKRSLRGTFGDGSAYVKAWTFSGNVIVSKPK